MADAADVRVTLDLESLGELCAGIVRRFAESHSIDLGDDPDWRTVVEGAWEQIRFMHERAEFANDAMRDIEAL